MHLFPIHVFHPSPIGLNLLMRSERKVTDRGPLDKENIVFFLHVSEKLGFGKKKGLFDHVELDPELSNLEMVPKDFRF